MTQGSGGDCAPKQSNGRGASTPPTSGPCGHGKGEPEPAPGKGSRWEGGKAAFVSFCLP